jgi:hypothetical protein
MRLHCAEVLSSAARSRPQHEPGGLSGREAKPPPQQVRALVIDVRVEGFFVERFDERGELVGATQHDTMDEAMAYAYSEYELADWKACPEDANPLQYIRECSDGYRDLTPVTDAYSKH